MKSIVLKYMEYSLKGDLKAKNLVDPLCVALGVNRQEKEALDTIQMPQTWSIINQAVGTWANAFEEFEVGGSAKRKQGGTSRGGIQAGTPKNPPGGASSSSTSGHANSNNDSQAVGKKQPVLRRDTKENTMRTKVASSRFKKCQRIGPCSKKRIQAEPGDFTRPCNPRALTLRSYAL